MVREAQVGGLQKSKERFGIRYRPVLCETRCSVLHALGAVTTAVITPLWDRVLRKVPDLWLQPSGSSPTSRTRPAQEMRKDGAEG
jgi:hypothetical protein